jgi:hypothetical protein
MADRLKRYVEKENEERKKGKVYTVPFVPVPTNAKPVPCVPCRKSKKLFKQKVEKD